MMLKVEAYGGNGNEELSQPVLHVCLATAAAASETGVCLTVGRKEGLVQFEQDKSVSRREHCIFRFVSTTDSAFPCQTPEQNEAVDSLHHLAVVLENQGKLGTILVHEPEDQPERKTKKTSTNDDDDSATVDSAATMDDGDVVPGFASQASASVNATAAAAMAPSTVLSKVAQNRLGEEVTKQVRLDFLGPGQNRILLPLKNPNGRVIVQCGKLGSTLIITRLEPIRFVRSGFTSKKKLQWLEKLHWIGAHEVTSWSLDKTNSHKNDDAEGGDKGIAVLVTPKQEASGKQLAAWSLHIPIVAPTYMEALLDRTDSSLRLPDPNDYEPPGKKKNTFWTDVTPDQTLLQGTTFLSTGADADFELLAAAAGSSVFKLYKSKSPEQDLKPIGEGCFGLDMPRRKMTKTLKKHHIPLVSLKKIAQVIVEQNPKLIHPSFEKVISQAKQTQTMPLPTGRGGTERSQARNEEKDDDCEEKDDDCDTVKRPRLAERHGAVTRSDKAKCEDDEEDDRLQRPKRVEKRETAAYSDKAKHKQTKTSSYGTSKSTATGKDNMIVDDVSRKNESADKEIDMDTSRTGTSRLPLQDKSSMDIDDDENDEIRGGLNKAQAAKPKTTQLSSDREGGIQSDSNQPPGSKKQERVRETQKKRYTEKTESQSNKRKQMTVSDAQRTSARQLSAHTSKGWLEVAPKAGKQRRKLLRSPEEIKEMTGYDEVLPAAETKIMPGLVGQPMGPTTVVVKDGVRDFRAFRKNIVPRSGGNDNTLGSSIEDGNSQGSYRLRLHRPKESAGEHYEFEEQRRALEEQQRRADALFRDSGGRTAASRRRR